MNQTEPRTQAKAKLLILSELVRHGPANFYQLQRRLGEWTKGHTSIYLEAENVVLWAGMSKMFTEALGALRHDERLVQMEVITDEDYATTGALLTNLPVAEKGLAGAPYAATCWLPARLKLVEPHTPPNEPEYALTKVELPHDAAEALAKLLALALGVSLVHECGDCQGTGVVDGQMCGCPCHAEQIAREAKEQDEKAERDRARRERGGK